MLLLCLLIIEWYISTECRQLAADGVIYGIGRELSQGSFSVHYMVCASGDKVISVYVAKQILFLQKLDKSYYDLVLLVDGSEILW